MRSLLLHLLIILTIVLVTPLPLLCEETKLAKWEKEEFEVYAAIINEMVDGDPVVIEETTASLSFEAWIPHLSDSWSDMPTNDMLLDWTEKNREACPLPQRIPLQREYVLLSEQEHAEFFKSGGGWSSFYRRYPKPDGLLRFSRVAFDSDKDTALVYFYRISYYLSSVGSFLLLKKDGDRWVVKQEGIILIS